MNLKICFDCGKKTVCKYYDYWDPRGCEGNCRQFVDVVKKDTTTRTVESFSPMSKSEQKPGLKVGDQLFRIVYSTTAKGEKYYAVRKVFVKTYNIEQHTKDFGTSVFRTKSEAEHVAKINIFGGKTND